VFTAYGAGAIIGFSLGRYGISSVVMSRYWPSLAL